MNGCRKHGLILRSVLNEEWNTIGIEERLSGTNETIAAIKIPEIRTTILLIEVVLDSSRLSTGLATFSQTTWRTPDFQ